MKPQRVTITLTMINLVLLIFNLGQITRQAVAQDVPLVLRGHALEIVDTQGRVRASITVEPPVTVDSRKLPGNGIISHERSTRTTSHEVQRLRRGCRA